MKPGITFQEMFNLIEARLKLLEVRFVLWSWRVQGAEDRYLRAAEDDYGKALDRVWEAQQRAA